MATVVREVRGIPLWLIREYLEELGGTARGEDAADGDGWTGSLEQIEDFQIGSLAIGQVRITLEGDDGVVERINTLLDDKLLRAGG
ncbi:MAG: DUF1952 domain-containing protein [Planctomycetota bacterium]